MKTVLLVGLGFMGCQVFILGSTAWAVSHGSSRGYWVMLLLSPAWMLVNLFWLWLWFQATAHFTPVTVRLIQATGSALATFLILWLWMGKSLTLWQMLGLGLYVLAAIISTFGSVHSQQDVRFHKHSL